mmetsp:Transcript_12507/g.44247  ORF Transcript_12507/g.44247 Transcript_12507/m.44247 type:complete len:381 (-) Transcript_12507:9-1151(-)
MSNGARSSNSLAATAIAERSAGLPDLPPMPKPVSQSPTRLSNCSNNLRRVERTAAGKWWKAPASANVAATQPSATASGHLASRPECSSNKLRASVQRAEARQATSAALSVGTEGRSRRERIVCNKLRAWMPEQPTIAAVKETWSGSKRRPCASPSSAAAWAQREAPAQAAMTALNVTSVAPSARKGPRRSDKARGQSSAFSQALTTEFPAATAPSAPMSPSRRSSSNNATAGRHCQPLSHALMADTNMIASALRPNSKRASPSMPKADSQRAALRNAPTKALHDTMSGMRFASWAARKEANAASQRSALSQALITVLNVRRFGPTLHILDSASNHNDNCHSAARPHALAVLLYDTTSGRTPPPSLVQRRASRSVRRASRQ